MRLDSMQHNKRPGKFGAFIYSISAFTEGSAMQINVRGDAGAWQILRRLLLRR